ncbi:hypothetical protein [Qipengyuania atrilutea]|uniref:Uncharacterized protein n=1 Tax=Qipengyuania atrilutea TaxID=2744473 RepID=A0A850H480_9SPHN|nr:hypothetical protein [Actirhodobacter atriluteus]NVD45400.1 hypothetical protein [Actirhodobacter atriluteus]
MADYEKPNIPPATPPTIDPKADPVDARELAEEDGDSESAGTVEASEKDESEGAEARRKMKKIRDRDGMDGAGEAEMNATTPTELLPPD